MNIVNLVIVIFLYIFALALCLFVVGTLAERMHIKQKMSSRQGTMFIVVISLVIYIAILFLFLNDWAVGMVRATSNF